MLNLVVLIWNTDFDDHLEPDFIAVRSESHSHLPSLSWGEEKWDEKERTNSNGQQKKGIKRHPIKGEK